jgi:hypothetical protein
MAIYDIKNESKSYDESNTELNNEEEKETVDILEFSNDTINPISPASTPISLTSSNNSAPITLSKPCLPPSSPTTSSLANLQIYLQSKYKVGYH